MLRKDTDVFTMDTRSSSPVVTKQPNGLAGTGQICHHQPAALLPPRSTGQHSTHRRTEHTSELFPQRLAAYSRCKNGF